MAASAGVIGQYFRGARIAQMVARIDAADPPRPGEADVPRPPRLVRRGDRIAFDRHVRAIVGQLARERAVGEQLVLHAPERRLQRAADQFGTETRTVEVKVGRERARFGGDDMIDGAAFGIACGLKASTLRQNAISWVNRCASIGFLGGLAR